MDVAPVLVGQTEQSYDAAGIVVSRRRGARHESDGSQTFAREDAFDVTVQLCDTQAHRLWRGEELIAQGPRSRGSLSITDLRMPWHRQYLSAFDEFRLHVSDARMRRFAEDVGRTPIGTLKCPEDHPDPVLLSLAQALIPSLEDPTNANPLFVEQIGLAALAHLAQTYGGLYLPVDKKGTLAPWQERRLTEFLETHYSEAFSIADLASLCDLSRSYFIKAFKESFGRAPHKWLTEYRVERVKDLLMQDQPIADIALLCGFSDQSHMTRIFTGLTGHSPGRFRRLHR
ncbi:AraC family transcriptional regulator [Allorhizobium taibaishanense]|uniref:AraC family transcriptional regulator n=1 Tax=Allorhizobium taibaishanense TaxID=887144 RepID=A0A1Q9A6K7_9HYPH|nr:AraC family transcriptional regulator [Allorhizobium taibaishanense]MBB4008650.1 AraC-like DNA-binding protein [Allorhizobium taibaishanense]OLP50216.1 AraC family transcriptional regulator [Allorhizobium taibaishanense]